MNEGDRPQVDIENNDDQFTAFANSRVSERKKYRMCQAQFKFLNFIFHYNSLKNSGINSIRVKIKRRHFFLKNLMFELVKSFAK